MLSLRLAGLPLPHERQINMTGSGTQAASRSDDSRPAVYIRMTFAPDYMGFRRKDCPATALLVASLRLSTCYGTNMGTAHNPGLRRCQCWLLWLPQARQLLPLTDWLVPYPVQLVSSQTYKCRPTVLNRCSAWHSSPFTCEVPQPRTEHAAIPAPALRVDFVPILSAAAGQPRQRNTTIRVRPLTLH